MQIGLPGVLGVVFLVLKLTHYIDWSWVWVLSPFWISLLVWFILLIYVASRKSK